MKKNKTGSLIKILSIIGALIMLFTACSSAPTVPAAKEDVYNPDKGVDKTGTPIPIAEGGHTDYKIAVTLDASPAIVFAAQELAQFLKSATGAEADIIADTHLAAGQKYFSLGSTQMLANAGFNSDYSQLNYDGFYIRTKGQNIYIEAENERGILYGVYEFLERFLGIRFVSSDFTHVPQSESLQIYPLNIMERPAFRYRNFYTDMLRSDKLFALRSRMFADMVSGGQDAEKYAMINEWDASSDPHNALFYVPENTYGTTHPEFYSTYTNPGTVYTELCYTNGITDDGEIDQTMDISVAKAVVNTIKSQIESSDYVRIFFIGKSDDPAAFCKCDRCKASDELYGGDNGGQTGTMIVFMNAVAREINEWTKQNHNGREISIAFFGYQYTEVAPVITVNGELRPIDSRVMLDKNVYVRFTPINANYARGFTDPRQDERYLELFENWRVITNNFMIWDYNINFVEYMWYYPNLDYIKENLELYESIGTAYVMNQSTYNEMVSWQSALKGYITAKLYWNTNHDVSKLIEEFVNLYYGTAAAPYVLQFIDDMEKHFAVLKEDGLDIEPSQYSVGSPYFSADLYPLEFLERSIETVRQASKAALADNTLTDLQKTAYDKRITAIILTPQRMILKNYEAYYIEGKRQFAEDFFANCDKAGAKWVDEGMTSLEQLRKELLGN